MDSIVTYREQDRIAKITIDDGKANAVGFAFVEGMNEALDRAEQDEAVVLLTGRPGKFSAGFDLNVVLKGGEDAARLTRSGAELAVRVMSWPRPVILACNGHCMAMGALLLLTADYRIGVIGDYKIGLNEVAIGMAMPGFGVEICRGRLTPVYFNRSLANAEIFDPEGAVQAGFLDMAVPEEKLMETAHGVIASMAALNMNAHHLTKMRIRKPAIEATRKAIETELYLPV
jgi:enoyl-CoA hydratase